MAGINITFDSQFKPFSYQDLLSPILLATQAHQDLEERYASLAEKAGVWERNLDANKDEVAYELYRSYVNDLERLSNKLAMEGLNTSNRKDALMMRARFGRDIVPIENAYKRREELSKELRTLKAQNPTLFIETDVTNSSVDDFLNNPNLDYGATYSGALLAQQVGEMAAGLKDSLVNKGKFTNTGIAFYYERLLQYGYTPEQIRYAIEHPESGNKVLTQIVELALNSSGMKEWATPEQLRAARAYANQGLYKAIGKTNVDNYFDSHGSQMAIMAQKHAYDVEMENIRHKNAMLENGNPNGSLSDVNWFPMFDTEEASKADDLYSKYSNYFYKKDGKWYITEAGVRKYFEETFVQDTNSLNIERKGKYVPSTFKQDMNALGIVLPEYLKGGTTADEKNIIGNQWNQKVASIHNREGDATQYTTIFYKEDNNLDTQKSIKSGLNIGNVKDLNGLVFKDGKFIPGGKSLSKEDLKSDNYTVLGYQVDDYGTIALVVEDEESNVSWHKATFSNYGAQKKVSEAARTVAKYKDKAQRKILTDKELEEYEIAYQTVNANLSQLSYVNTTGKQQWEVFPQ